MSVISRKNQITIPARVLREAGLEPGDDMRVVVEAPGRIRLERAEDLVRRFAGSLDSAAYPPGYLDALRSEWE